MAESAQLKRSGERPDVRTEIAAIYHFYRPQLPTTSRWEDERDRWHELAFAAIAVMSGLSIDQSRRVANGLIELNLLTMAGCLDASKNGGAVSRLPAVAEALRVAGSSNAAIEKTIRVLIDIAVGVEHSFGKLQKMLRSAAEQMLKTLNDSIATPTIDESRKGQIFTMWLQNILEAPLSMTHADPTLVDFCERHHVSVHDLVEIADEADINLPVLDSLIRLDSEFLAQSGKNVSRRASK